MTYGFYDSLLDAREKYGDKAIIMDGQSETTYANLLSAIDSIERDLRRLGVKPKDKVGILAYNSPLWLASFFAIVKCECVAVCLNYSFTAEEVNECLSSSDCGCLLFGDCLGLSRDQSFVSKINLDKCRKIPFSSFRIEESSGFVRQNLSDAESEKPAYMIFSSGSTGKPKGCLLTQKSSLATARGFLDSISEIEGESICVGSPMFHIFGLSMCVMHIMYGGTLYLPKSFSSSTMVSFLNRFEIDSLIGVMTVIVRMLDDKDFSPDGYPSVKRIYTGGAPLMPVQCYRAERGFGSAVLLNAYGQSETDAGISVATPCDSAEKRANTVGKACSRREILIMGSDGICGPNEKGEVVVRDNGTICKGYYNCPKESQPIGDDGFLRTGDLGYFDDEGYLHLSGRIKDIIIKGGENIIPTEIEEKIASLDGISGVKVLGAKDSLYGESIEACVTLGDGVSLTESEIRARLKGKIPSFKMPSHIFVFDSFPLNPNGKLDVRTLSLKMLNRLNASAIGTDIANGINVLSMKFRKQLYMVPAIVGITDRLAESIGYKDAKGRNRIVLCVEEMLTEIVNAAYREGGDAEMSFTLFGDRLRISFTNESDRLIFDEASLSNRSLNVTIIVNYVDSIGYKRLKGGIVEYDMDFMLPADCNPEEFFR